MTDITTASPKPRGRPPGIRTAEVRSEPIREEVTRRQRVSKGGSQRDMLHIPQDMIPPDVDLQWIADTILGEPNRERTRYEQDLWEPVHQDMFDGRFDGMFMKKGVKGEITYGGLVLFWRPLEYTLEARAEEHSAARQAVGIEEAKMRAGQLDGVTLDTQHSTVRQNTKLNRERLPSIPVPR